MFAKDRPFYIERHGFGEEVFFDISYSPIPDERAAEMVPGLPILFTTGYARNAIVHHGKHDPSVELITKPFTSTELTERIRDLLDRRRSSTD